MSGNIQAKQLSFQEIFLPNSKYIVPLFQRGIEWGRENVSRLWKDLKEHAIDIKHENMSYDYLLGSVVIAKASNRSEIEVLDGQQRFTAITVLLWALYSAMKKMLNKLEKEIKKEIYNAHEEYLLGIRGTFLKTTFYDLNSAVQETLLSYSDKDLTEFLKANLLEDSIKIEEDKLTSLNQKKLLALFDELAQKVNEYTKELESKKYSLGDQFGELKNIAKVVLENTCVVEITVEKERAMQVFEALNNRGVRLDSSDIIKVNLFQSLPDKISEEEQKKCFRKWEEIKNLSISSGKDSSRFNVSIQQSVISRKGKILKMGDLEKDVVFKKNISPESKKFNFCPFEFLDNLREDVEIINCLKIKGKTLLIQSEEFNYVNELIANYRDIIKVNNLVPAYVAAIRRYANPKTKHELHKKNAKILEKILEAIEHFFVREYKFSRNPAKPEVLLRNSAELCEILISEENDDKVVKNIKNYLNKESSGSDVEEDLKDFSANNNKLNFYIQRKIAAKIFKTSPLDIANQKKNDLEHIAPQKPTDGDWSEFYRLANSKNQEEVETFDKIINKIGNHLILFKISNKKLKNFSYARKMAQYKDDWAEGYEKTVEKFQDGEKWTIDSINKRTSFLAKKAKELKVWDI